MGNINVLWPKRKACECARVGAVDAVLANVGKRLRALRRARRQTLEHIAKDTGYTAGYLSQIETGEAIPSLAALAAISAALGADITAFFPLETPAA